MYPNDDDLIELAGAILDGTPVDWASVASSASVDTALVGQLRVVAGLVDLHRRLPPPDDGRPTLPSGPGSLPSDLVRWGHLLLHEHVGRGSFGEVFRAWDTRLEREVALKLIDAASVSTPGSTAIEEGRLLARIRHPNVVSVYGAEQIGSRIGIWTEFIRGRTLDEIVRQDGPLDAASAVATGAEICAALEAVHRAGLLHRDIKAQNVMHEDGGRVVLMDLGAGVEHMVGTRWSVESLAGTPLYVAPEILCGGDPTVRSDVYSVGVLLFYLVTGSFPVAGQTLEEVRAAHRANRRNSLGAIRQELPRNFVTAVERALSPDAALRFDSADALRDALSTSVPGSKHKHARALSGSTGWLASGALAAVGLSVVFAVGRLSSVPSVASRDVSRAPLGLAAATQPVMRKVPAPAMGLFDAGAPSFDGRLYSNTDPNEDLMIFDLTSGAATRLTNRGRSDEMAEFSIPSPDGRQIAYSWLTLDDAYELRVAGVDGAPPRVLVPRGRADQVIPAEWSRDGSELLCLFRQPHGRSQVGLVSIATGNIPWLRDLGTSRPKHVTLSMDNRFVAFDTPAAGTEAQRDIVIERADGSGVRSTVTHPAEDVSPVWTPDGRHLFFISNRSGTFDGWIVEVVDGIAAGDPFLVARNLGEISIAGFTSSGALYFWRQSGDMDVYTQAIEGGGNGRPERVAARLVSSNSGPAWSPDGRSLAYISRRSMGAANPQAFVVIHNFDGSHDREIAVPLASVAPLPLRWSPDGRELLIRGRDSQDRAGVFALRVESGELLPGVVVPGSRAGSVLQARWWIDGRSIAYISPRGLVVRERGSDTERVVFDPASETPPLRLSSFEASRDGTSIAMAGVVIGTDPPVHALLVTSIGGVPFEVARAVYPDQLALQSWMPNGHELLFTRRNARIRSPHALWRVSLDAVARDTGIRIPGFTQTNMLQVDPGGKRIAYTADQTSWDLWVMEHFLPEAR